MSKEKMSLPNLDNVNIVGGPRLSLMEIADPFPELYQRLTRKELANLALVGIKYQNKFADMEIKRLELQKQALIELQKAFTGIR